MPAKKSDPDRLVDPYWTVDSLKSAVDALLLSPKGIWVDDLAHQLETGHELDPKTWNRPVKCETCDRKERRGDSLAGTLAALAAEAEEGTSWRSLDFVRNTNGGWTVRLEQKYIDEVSAQRAKRMLHEASQPPPSRTPTVPIDAYFWPEDRVRRLERLSERAQREADYELASIIIYSLIPGIEKWRMMRIVDEAEGRRVLKDFAGDTWVAKPLASVDVADTATSPQDLNASSAADEDG